jgi:membrane protein DedA with SNARE-associated domain
MLGYLAGASYQRVEKIAGQASAILLAVVILVVLLFVLRRRHQDRDRQSEESNDP